MPFPIWVAIAGTVVALAFCANGWRHIKAGEGHLANAGRLHIIMSAMFVPILWLVVLMQVMA